MFLEMLVIAIHPPLAFDFQFFITQSGGNESKYHLDDILSAFSILKLYFLLRLAPELTLMSGPKAWKICELLGFYPDFLFYVKISLRDRPLLILIAIFTLLMFSIGALVQIFERGIFLSRSLKSGIID